MMKHSETQRPIECRVGEGHGRGILLDYGDIVSAHTARERICEGAIDFHAGEALDTSPKKISGYARAGANFEDIRTNVETVKHPWKDIRLYRISPISGTAEPAMSKVHGSDSCLLKTA
jgi:hypothetical protein